MSTPNTTLTTNSVFQHFAAALLPFFILVIGASQTILKAPLNWNDLLVFALIVLGAIATYIVKLVNGSWQGALKTGIAILTTVLTALLPFILPGGFDPKVNVPLIIVAVLNALATEFGVQIRTTAPPVVVTGLTGPQGPQGYPGPTGIMGEPGKSAMPAPTDYPLQ